MISTFNYDIAELGENLRVHARQASRNNPTELPPLKLPAPWTTGEAITSGMVRSNAGKWYVAANGGNCGVTAPTHITGQIVSDGTVLWSFVDYAQISADDPGAPVITVDTSLPGFSTNAYTPVANPDVFDLLGCEPAVFGGGPFWRPTVFNSDATTKDVGNGASARFQTDAKKFVITISANVKPPRVVVDGRFVELGAQIDSASARYVTYEFPTRKMRTVELRGSKGDFVFTGVRVGATDIVTKAPSRGIVAVAIGDSMWDGSNYGPFLTPEPQMICDRLGWDQVWNMSKGGTGAVNPGSGPFYTFGQRVAQAATHDPDVWLFLTSTNDNGFPTGAEYETAVTSAYRTIFGQIREVSDKPIIVVGAQCIDDSLLTSKISALENAVNLAVSQFGDDEIYFEPIRNAQPYPLITGAWNNSPKPTSLNSTDYIVSIDPQKTHPADLGSFKRAEFIAEALKRNVLPRIGQP